MYTNLTTSTAETDTRENESSNAGFLIVGISCLYVGIVLCFAAYVKGMRDRNARRIPPAPVVSRKPDTPPIITVVLHPDNREPCLAVLDDLSC